MILVLVLVLDGDGEDASQFVLEVVEVDEVDELVVFWEFVSQVSLVYSSLSLEIPSFKEIPIISLKNLIIKKYFF